MKKFILFLFGFLCYYLLFLFSVYISLKFFINFKSIPDLNRIDAIVVLAGGKGRIELGKEILKLNKNIYLIISGANPSFSIDFLKRELNLKGKNIIIENNSKNTIENGYEVKKIIKKLRLKNLLLITSKSHMIRALIIFKIILPEGIKIYPVAVNDKITYKKVLKENIKLIYFFIKYFLKGV